MYCDALYVIGHIELVLSILESSFAEDTELSGIKQALEDFRGRSNDIVFACHDDGCAQPREVQNRCGQIDQAIDRALDY